MLERSVVVTARIFVVIVEIMFVLIVASVLIYNVKPSLVVATPLTPRVVVSCSV
jgi:hypothetical protein